MNLSYKAWTKWLIAKCWFKLKHLQLVPLSWLHMQMVIGTFTKDKKLYMFLYILYIFLYIYSYFILHGCISYIPENHLFRNMSLDQKIHPLHCSAYGGIGLLTRSHDCMHRLWLYSVIACLQLTEQSGTSILTQQPQKIRSSGKCVNFCHYTTLVMYIVTMDQLWETRCEE